MHLKLRPISLENRPKRRPPVREGFLARINLAFTAFAAQTGFSGYAHRILAARVATALSEAAKDHLYALRQQVAAGGFVGFCRCAQIALRLV